MLNLMRKHARNWLMKIILGIIVIVFIFYFGSIGGRQRAERIATIDGKTIVYADFQREYQRTLDMYHNRLGQALTEELLKELNLKQKTLDNLVNQLVVLKKAEEMKIAVTDEDVKMSILSYPAFQQNGVFNERVYQQVLQNEKMSPEEFEEMLKKNLIASRMENLIQDGVKVSDQEMYDLYRIQKEKIDIDFIQIAPKDFTAGLKPTAAELESFLKAHEGQFRVPEQLQVRYLAFMAQDYAASVKISDEEIADYYEKNKSRWKKGDKVQPLAEVRNGIIAEMGQIGGMYTAAGEVKKAHDTIYQEENFDGYAAQKKLTIHTSGLFRISEPPAEFRLIKDFTKIVSRLEAKEITRALQGEKGYYIFQLVAKKAPYVPTLKEIQAEVEKQYRETEAKRLAQKEAEDLLARLNKGETLAGIAKAKGLKVGETGLFQPGGAIPKLGASEELTEALFQLSEKKPYTEKPHMVEGNFVIVRFKGRGRVDDAEFASQKSVVANQLRQIKTEQLVSAWIEGSKAAMIKEGRLVFSRDIKDL
jgi:peptidyl-prolyl cis-trans isomerase D